MTEKHWTTTSSGLPDYEQPSMEDILQYAAEYAAEQSSWGGADEFIDKYKAIFADTMRKSQVESYSARIKELNKIVSTHRSDDPGFFSAGLKRAIRHLSIHRLRLATPNTKEKQ